MKALRNKKTKFLLSLACSVALLLSSFSPLIAADSGTSTEVDKLKSQQQDLAAKLAEIQKQISEYGKLLDQNRKEQNTLKNQIAGFDNQIHSTDLQIQATQTQIDNVKLQIQALQIQIDQKKAEIEQNKKVMSQLIVQLDQLDDSSALNMSLGASNFSDFLDQVQYTHSVQDTIYDLLKKIKEIKATLESQQTDLQKTLEKMNELQEQLQVSQDALQGQRQSRQTLLDQTKGNERTYQKLRSQNQAAEAKLEGEINDLDNAIRAKLGQRVIQPANGVLACPINGRLTQGYGKTNFASHYVNGFHNGIDVANVAGTPIAAPADAIVRNVDTGEAAYGNWVTLEHTIQTASGTRKVISLMAHMQRFTVHPGQQVFQGDIIGYEGSTGDSTGPHVHITIFDAEGYGVAPGKYTSTYGHYSVPFGYTYDPRQFMKC